ncbi:MAG: hypothetical protein Q8L86_12855 [Vicinamibacterales bacterium]|nr:hypothetical protein [Vicinamibacterales bacterium]
MQPSPSLQVPPDTPTFPITEEVIEVEPFTPEIGVGDVVLGTVELIAVVLFAALCAGLLAGGLYIWWRQRGAVTEIEARGHTHNYFRD